jgi:antitoxin component YwqK of YwqJK toxin-antitoxin module
MLNKKTKKQKTNIMKRNWMIVIIVVIIAVVLLVLSRLLNIPPGDKFSLGTMLETIEANESNDAFSLLKNSDLLSFDQKQKVFLDSTNKPFDGELLINDDNTQAPHAKMNLQNGKMNGDYEFYYPDGKLMEQGNYTENLKHGYFTRYYENGNKWYQIRYRYNVKTGEWIVWDDQGKKLYTGSF